MVVEDVHPPRHSLIAKIKLAHWIRHPLERFNDRWPRANQFRWAVLDEFPIAPIAYRVDENHLPNRLGQKYERLLELNQQLVTELGPMSGHSFDTFLAYGTDSPVTRAIDDIIGIGPDDELLPDPDCLISLLSRSLITLSPHAASLANACLLSISFTGQSDTKAPQ